MLYQFWKKSGSPLELGRPMEIEFDDRFEVTRWVEKHKEKPVAILYPHKVAQLIWIDMDC